MTSEPTIDDEIERKTLDSLAQIMQDQQQGVVSQSEASYALRILFMNVSGLVSQDTFDLVTEASKELGDGQTKSKIRRFFVNITNQRMVLIEYEFGSTEILIKQGRTRTSNDVGAWERISRVSFESEVNPFEAAMTRFNSYIASLLRTGFREIV